MRTAIYTYRVLLTTGFAPSHQGELLVLVRTIWLLVVTRFSWVEMFGLVIYILLAPLTLAWHVLFWVLKRTKGTASPVQPNVTLRLLPRKSRQAHWLSLGLLIWFVLFANSPARLPLIVAVTICVWLFLNRLYATTLYTTAVTSEEGDYIARLGRLPYDYLLGLTKQLAEGKLTSDGQVKRSIAVQKWMLRKIRHVALILRGKAGKRRASLIVLTEYSLSLMVLGFLLVFFGRCLLS